MNVLLIGSGGREHALGWALLKSLHLTKLFSAPGNGGLEELAECITLNIGDHQAVLDFCQLQQIALVIIGPEGPLVAGLADDLEAAGIAVFGPGKAGARLEGSKGFTKDLCTEYNIPTADYRRFSDPQEAKDYVADHPLPVVIKADGLAAGKGVIIAENKAQALQAIEDCFSGKWDEKGEEILIEAFLSGEEASFFALIDGTRAVPFGSAQDHKRAFDGDLGPNTGGMGAYSPAPIMSTAISRQVMTEIIEPTVEAMKARGISYKGVLYAGLMITPEGPKLIEYNVRFGDPECQVLMMRLKSDLLSLLLATAKGGLEKASIEWRDEVALTIVMATRGYPGAYQKGSIIEGLEELTRDEGLEIFHAGTKRQEGKTIANGGRVLNITAVGRDVGEAQRRGYQAVEKINWPEGIYRTDIGWRAVLREKAAQESQ